MAKLEPQEISLRSLLIDPNNFRFQGPGGAREVPVARYCEASVQSAALSRLEKDGLDDLRGSILKSGFLSVDRIVVKAHDSCTTDASGEPDERYVVVEGNRRVATLLTLEREQSSGAEVPDGITKVFDAVPCLVLTEADRATELAIMGVRHVGGIREWGGYQGAKIVWLLKTEEHLDTIDVAQKLGLSAQEVNRRHRAYGAIETMLVDEEFGEYAAAELYALFHEAIANPTTREHFGWSASAAEFADVEKVREFYRLVCPRPAPGSSRSHLDPKITSYTEVRQLKTILRDEDARESLADLEQPFSAAIGIVTQGTHKSWRKTVKSALRAMGTIPADDIEALSPDDEALLKNISDKALKIIALGISAAKDE